MKKVLLLTLALFFVLSPAAFAENKCIFFSTQHKKGVDLWEWSSAPCTDAYAQKMKTMAHTKYRRTNLFSAYCTSNYGCDPVLKSIRKMYYKKVGSFPNLAGFKVHYQY